MEEKKKQQQQQKLTHSPSGRIRIATEDGQHQRQQQRLLRPDGKPVAPTSGCQEPVLINVYDLHWINRLTKSVGLAAYHTGLELHGVEIAYGDCGVYTMKPKDVGAMEAAMMYKKSIRLGSTNYSREDALLIGRRLGRCDFTGVTYDVLRRNCNHFSAALGRLLCPHADFPARINGLAKLSTRLSFVERRIRRYADGEDVSHDDGKGDADSDDSGKTRRRRGLRELSANNLARLSSTSNGSQLKKAETCEN